jgi:hypothetical protein
MQLLPSAVRPGPGAFEIMIGTSSADIRARATLEVFGK